MLPTLPQYILWKTAVRDGKTVKLPVSPHTLDTCDAHDRSNWISYEQAHQVITVAQGYGIGYVFSKDDPYFFVDIDHCLENGKWSAVANDLMGRLSGSYVEVSQSREGLHIIGKYAQCKEHACKNKILGIEMYTDGRFCALTGINAIGNAETDVTTNINGVADYYFSTESNVSEGGALDWRTTPVSEWSGTEDDDELIKIMLNAKSGASVFGDKASLSDLWNCNVPVLSKAYPDGFGNRSYDESSVDGALALHLAFWTGKNHERIKNLMLRSQLVRDKWTSRDDYLSRTISNAVNLCTNVYKSGKIITEPVVEPTIREGFQFLTVTQQIEFFKGCVYILSLHRIYTPNGDLLKPEQFRVAYGGYIFALDSGSEKTTKNAWEVFTESQAISFPKVSGICFRPELSAGAIIEEENHTLLNTYVPVDIHSQYGDVSPFITHLHKVLPNGQDAEILLSYMAACVQYKGVKFQWAPVLQGCEGNGKTLFITCLSYAVGNRYTHLPNAQELGGNGSKFNSWIQNKLFIGVEEIYVSDRREVADALKPLITNARIEIQGKGIDQVTGDNRANFLLCTNHKDAILKSKNDRRYCVLYTAQQSKDDMIKEGWLTRAGTVTEYFPNLYNWLRAGGYAAVTHYLENYDIPDALNPATKCHRAPVSSCLDEVLRISMGSVEQEVLEAIDMGEVGFRGGWISSAMLGNMLEEKGRAKQMPPIKRRKMLEEMGFIPVSGLKDGRTNTIIMMEGCKPRLYLQKGHIYHNITSGAEIVEKYMKDQGYSYVPQHKAAGS